MSYALFLQTSDGGRLSFTEPDFRAALRRLDKLAAGITEWQSVSISPRSEPCPSDPPTHRA